MAPNPNTQNMKIPTDAELDGGFSWHAEVTLPTASKDCQQTLFDIGQLETGIRLTIFIDKNNKLAANFRPLQGQVGQISVGGIYEKFVGSGYVHVGAQVEEKEEDYFLRLYFDKEEVASGKFKGSVGDKISGSISMGHDLDGKNDVGMFSVGQISLWIAPIPKERLTEFLRGFGRNEEEEGLLNEETADE